LLKVWGTKKKTLKSLGVNLQIGKIRSINSFYSLLKVDILVWERELGFLNSLSFKLLDKYLKK